MPDQYFVYYDYDYDEMGGKGLERFETEEQALDFIQQRIKGDSMAGFTLIKGEQQKLIAVEKVTKIAIDRG